MSPRTMITVTHYNMIPHNTLMDTGALSAFVIIMEI